MKANVDSRDGNFKTVPLAGVVGDSEVLPSLSTFLSVIVILFTTWVRACGSPMYQSFACDKALSMWCIIAMPMRIDMGLALIDLASQQILCSKYSADPYDS